MRSSALFLAAAVLTATLAPNPASAQDLPLAPVRGADQGVWPAYEGWYDNQDGSYIIYFGYYNRNTEQVIEIPLGEHNFIEPAEFDGDQPTRFEARRHWGVFGIRVPADFGAQNKIYWNLVVDGETYRVPGHLKPEWKTDALAGEAGAGNSPPVLRFGSDEGRGPLGVTGSQTLTTAAGEPLEIRVWARDDGLGGLSIPGLELPEEYRTAPGVTLTWFKHRGPGDVRFTEEEAKLPADGGEMTTLATFSAPGDYVLRVRANDASGLEVGGHAQCCWTNGFVNVTVTR